MSRDFITCDLLDESPECQVLAVSSEGNRYQHFGGVKTFGGEAVTVKCFEDNSRVKELLNTPGGGRVLVVDGGGSLRCALIGDMIAQSAIDNSWAGVLIYGCVRDAGDLLNMPIGVMALGAIPRKSNRQGVGEVDLPINFSGISIKSGDYIYCDLNGAIVSDKALI